MLRLTGSAGSVRSVRSSSPARRGVCGEEWGPTRRAGPSGLEASLINRVDPAAVKAIQAIGAGTLEGLRDREDRTTIAGGAVRRHEEDRRLSAGARACDGIQKHLLCNRTAGTCMAIRGYCSPLGVRSRCLDASRLSGCWRLPSAKSDRERTRLASPPPTQVHHRLGLG